MTQSNEKGDGSFLATMESALKKEGVDVPATSAAPAPAAAAAPVPAPKGILANVHKGRSITPPRILLVGTEGIGKSSWAAAAPAPIIIPTEDGLDHIDCEKFTWPDPTAPDGRRKKANTFQEVVECLTGLATEPHHYRTVTIDSADWLEKLIWANVCRRFGKKNIEDIGYAKGYIYALDEWRDILELLTRCRGRGMATIMIAHAKIEKFEDPELPAYDRYVPKLHKHAIALLKEWHDCVLFASYKRAIKLVEGKSTDERPIGIPVGANGGERVVRTVGGAVCDAKNRYDLAPEIPLAWGAFQDGFTAFIKKNEKKGA
jgi:hypothetical protein